MYEPRPWVCDRSAVRKPNISPIGATPRMTAGVAREARVHDDGAALLERLHDGADVVFGDADLQPPVGLEDDRARVLQRFAERVARRGVDRDLGLTRPR